MGGADAVGVVWLRRGSSEDKTKQNESRYQKRPLKNSPTLPLHPRRTRIPPIDSMIQWYKKESGNHGGGELGGGAGVGRGPREGAKWQLEKKKKKEKKKGGGGW